MAFRLSFFNPHELTKIVLHNPKTLKCTIWHSELNYIELHFSDMNERLSYNQISDFIFEKKLRFTKADADVRIMF